MSAHAATGELGSRGQVVGTMIPRRLASAGASAAYLTVSELFPLEARAMAIALFYSVGTGIAALSPTIFGALRD
jgi:hypothetical protein